MLGLPLVATFTPAALPMRFVSPGRSAVCAARFSPDLLMVMDVQPGEPGYKRARLKYLLRRTFQPKRVAAEEAEAAEAAAYLRRKEEKAAAKKAYEEELERERQAAEKATPVRSHQGRACYAVDRAMDGEIVQTCRIHN